MPPKASRKVRGGKAGTTKPPAGGGKKKKAAPALPPASTNDDAPPPTDDASAPTDTQAQGAPRQTPVPPPKVPKVAAPRPTTVRKTPLRETFIAPPQIPRTPANTAAGTGTEQAARATQPGGSAKEQPAKEQPAKDKGELTAEQIAERHTATGAWAETKTPAPRARVVKDKTKPLFDQFPSQFYAPSKKNARILEKEGHPGRLDFDPLSDEILAVLVVATPDVPTPDTRPAGEASAAAAAAAAAAEAPAGEAPAEEGAIARQPDEEGAAKAPNEAQVVLYLVQKNSAICSFLYGVNWFAGWIATDAAGGRDVIDTRSKRFVDLRKYSLDNSKNFKHAFLFRCMLPHVRQWGALAENVEVVNMDMDDEASRDWVMEQLKKTDMNRDIWETVYRYVAKYIDFNATFLPADPEEDPMQHLPYYALLFIHSSFVIMALRIHQSEMDMNANTKNVPDTKGWVKDLNLRKEYRDLFDSINFHDSLAEFDRDDLVDITPEDSALKRAVAAKGLNKAVVKQNAPNMPPPPKKRRIGGEKTAEAQWAQSHNDAIQVDTEQGDAIQESIEDDHPFASPTVAPGLRARAATQLSRQALTHDDTFGTLRAGTTRIPRATKSRPSIMDNARMPREDEPRMDVQTPQSRAFQPLSQPQYQPQMQQYQQPQMMPPNPYNQTGGWYSSDMPGYGGYGQSTFGQPSPFGQRSQPAFGQSWPQEAALQSPLQSMQGPPPVARQAIARQPAFRQPTARQPQQFTARQFTTRQSTARELAARQTEARQPTALTKKTAMEFEDDDDNGDDDAFSAFEEPQDEPQDEHEDEHEGEGEGDDYEESIEQGRGYVHDSLETATLDIETGIASDEDDERMYTPTPVPAPYVHDRFEFSD